MICCKFYPRLIRALSSKKRIAKQCEESSLRGKSDTYRNFSSNFCIKFFSSLFIISWPFKIVCVCYQGEMRWRIYNDLKKLWLRPASVNNLFLIIYVRFYGYKPFNDHFMAINRSFTETFLPERWFRKLFNNHAITLYIVSLQIL